MRRCKVRYIITGFFLIVRFTFAGLELAESGVPRDLSMKRSRKLISLLLIVCTFLFASCASTTITNVWKDEGYQGKAKKIVVIMVARLPDMRNMFEGRFVAELQARGNQAIQSHMPGHVNAVPLYYGSWGTYYAIVSVDYGHTGDLEVSYVETNLYDINNEKLIWSAHSKTERAQGEQQLINKFIDVILKKMSSDNIIQ
jgi:hypothetical protein